MPERTCPVCGERFTPTTANQVYCPPTKRSGRGQARSKCATAAQNRAHRATQEIARCKGCGEAFARTRSQTNRVYCTDECHHKTKSERLKQPPKARASWPPAETRTAIAAYKRALRLDPCAYCGEQPCNGIDHIQPTGTTGDRADWTNWVGCCKRCNETKNTLPLLLALPWIPLSRAYHDERRRLYANHPDGRLVEGRRRRWQ